MAHDEDPYKVQEDVLRKVAKATQKGFERQGTHTDKYGGAMKPMATEPKRGKE